MQLVTQEAPISISLSQGGFCNESSSWLLRDADAQKNTGELQGKRFLGERAAIPPSHSLSIRVHKPTGQSCTRPTAPHYLPNILSNGSDNLQIS